MNKHVVAEMGPEEFGNTFDSFVEYVRSKAADAFNRDGGLPPTWFCQRRDGTVVFLVTEFDDDDDKDQIDRDMRIEFKINDVHRYVFITEAWMLEVKTDYRGLRPSLHPEKQEILSLIAEDENGDALSGYTLIHRNPKSKLAMIADLKVERVKHPCEGRFTNMFGCQNNDKNNDKTS
jgi:hypothetical protein